MTYTFPEAKVGLVETLCAIQIPHVQVKVVEIHSPSRLSAICHLLPPLECLDDWKRLRFETPVPIGAYRQIYAGARSSIAGGALFLGSPVFFLYSDTASAVAFGQSRTVSESFYGEHRKAASYPIRPPVSCRHVRRHRKQEEL